ncbi:MAG: hypothetical protein COU32_04035 [Candidatus Magasanikbacteria bacterium CG10_big_fil_rev_8_21_14_0_10_42_10]|uniref:Uncharacterized protein n=2 Tax=Candidatus Magasanikiibacteriota TaxID=1752731 RepID=A0A2H0TXG2_9BACT|nr:MAG: hypothetical protein COU32_04035 [Candidatus Magasanikbacteria bacterium CG10_big_fil_rev_8_21_14_0_10_42_10]PIZ94306.1 MAG: hypothetical protein COX82_00975 [Candidatus Magasanikbacteria bacterium CG_4_10_14_0_2_um_filter_41_10]
MDNRTKWMSVQLRAVAEGTVQEDSGEKLRAEGRLMAICNLLETFPKDWISGPGALNILGQLMLMEAAFPTYKEILKPAIDALNK